MLAGEIITRLGHLKTVDKFPREILQGLTPLSSHHTQTLARDQYMRWQGIERRSAFIVSRELDIPTGQDVFLLRTFGGPHDREIVESVSSVLEHPLPQRQTIIPGSSQITLWPASRLEIAQLKR